jgi:cytochrome c oxidase subunit IV
MYLHKYIYTCIFVFVGIAALLDYYGFYKYMTINMWVLLLIPIAYTVI